MARQSKVSVKSFIPAVLVAAKSVADGTLAAKSFTAEIAAKVGLSVADCETRYKRFAANKAYKAVFDVVAERIGGEVEFATVGQQGAPKLSDAQLNEWLSEAKSL